MTRWIVVVVIGVVGCGDDTAPECMDDGTVAECAGGLVVCELESEPVAWCQIDGVPVLAPNRPLPMCMDGEPVCPEDHRPVCVPCPGGGTLERCDPGGGRSGADAC